MTSEQTADPPSRQVVGYDFFTGQPVVIEAVQTDEPCVRCGKPVAPGQLYVAGPPVRHIGCRGAADWDAT